MYDECRGEKNMGDAELANLLYEFGITRHGPLNTLFEKVKADE
jgi:hypothetical protein